MESIQGMFDLSGRVALVTGSSRGIGRAIALTLGQAGAKVVFHGSRPSKALTATLEEARGMGISCESVTADLSDMDSTRRLLEQVETPDILVLNASLQKYMTIEDFDDEEFDREFITNVKSCCVMMRKMIPEMRRRGFGRVITIGSVNQYRPSPRLIMYSATKSALCTVAMALARTCAGDGVTVNNISPGCIATDRNAETLSDEDTRLRILDAIPAHRIGVAEDIAGTALLLASPAGSYITGADIPVTGGLHL